MIVRKRIVTISSQYSNYRSAYTFITVADWHLPNFDGFKTADCP